MEKRRAELERNIKNDSGKENFVNKLGPQRKNRAEKSYDQPGCPEFHRSSNRKGRFARALRKTGTSCLPDRQFFSRYRHGLRTRCERATFPLSVRICFASGRGCRFPVQ